MNTENKCYICGRTEETVKEYIFNSVITQKQINLESSRNNKKNVEEEYKNKIEKIQKIMTEVQQLPEYIKKMKVTTLIAEQNNLKHDFPIIEEVVSITNHSENSMYDELKKEFEKQVNESETRIENTKKNLFLNQDNTGLEKEFLNTNLNLKHSKWAIPIKNNGRFRDKARVQAPSLKDVPEKIEVPVCYICRSMFNEIMYMER